MMLRVFVHAAVLAVIAGCAAVPAGDARSARRDGPSTIVVHLRGLRPEDGAGPVAIAIWGDAASFMREGKWVDARAITLAESAEPVVFAGLQPGTYAVSAFHDVAASGSLRRGIFGIPIDPWAVSNTTSPIAPPSWKKAAFEVREGTNEITLEFMRNPGARK
jgi:uncharacterized protein (DUF2141 family)